MSFNEPTLKRIFLNYLIPHLTENFLYVVNYYFTNS